MTDSVYHNIVSAQQLRDIIKTDAQLAMNDENHAKQFGAVIVRGMPGIGKSTIVKAIADELNIGFVDIRLAQLERVDLCGLPTVEKGETKWCVPNFWPKDKNSAGILFFDELTSASADIQVAAYSIILDRRIPNSDYQIPDKWIIVAAGNRSNDRAVAKSMSSALANRFTHFELDADATEWTNYSIQHGLHPSVTGFIQFKPSCLIDMSDKQNKEQGFPTPRSWEKVSTMIKVFGSNEDVLQKCVYGAIGAGTGVEFMAFHKMQKQFENVVTWLTDENAEIKIPDAADQKYAVISALAYHIWRGDNAKDTQKRIDGLFRVLDNLTRDYQFLLLSLVSQGCEKLSRMQAIAALMSNEHYKEYMTKNKEAFAKKYQL